MNISEGGEQQQPSPEESEFNFEEAIDRVIADRLEGYPDLPDRIPPQIIEAAKRSGIKVGYAKAWWVDLCTAWTTLTGTPREANLYRPEAERIKKLLDEDLTTLIDGKNLEGWVHHLVSNWSIRMANDPSRRARLGKIIDRAEREVFRGSIDREALVSGIRKVYHDAFVMSPKLDDLFRRVEQAAETEAPYTDTDEGRNLFEKIKLAKEALLHHEEVSSEQIRLIIDEAKLRADFCGSYLVALAKINDEELLELIADELPPDDKEMLLFIQPYFSRPSVDPVLANSENYDENLSPTISRRFLRWAQREQTRLRQNITGEEV